MKEKITVIKVGGKIVEEEHSLSALLDRFAAIEGRKVLIHGGGRSATRIAESMGIESRMVEGRRITDEATLRVVTMVYGGLVNKNIVAKLQARNVNALGLTGADCNIITARKRAVKDIDYGFVGDVEKSDGDMLKRLIEQGIVPIIAPLTHDKMGNLLNTNADTMAAETAKALAGFYKSLLCKVNAAPLVKSVTSNLNAVTVGCIKRLNISLTDKIIVENIINNAAYRLKNITVFHKGMVVLN